MLKSISGLTLLLILALFVTSCATRTVFRAPPTAVYEERMYGMLFFDGAYMVMNIESLEIDEEYRSLLMLDDIVGDTVICIESFDSDTSQQNPAVRRRREICKTMGDIRKFVTADGDVRYESP